MASFTDLVADRILRRLDEFKESIDNSPKNDLERELAQGVRTHWHGLDGIFPVGALQGPNAPAAAVDGSRAVRAMNTGADWLIAQALLIGPGGLRLSDAETVLLRGEILQLEIDRCASMLMRNLELRLALKYVESGAGGLLLLDGSLYADLPHLLYPLEIPNYEDLPLYVLQAYLDLFEQSQQRGVLLVGIAKSARSMALGRTILDERLAPQSAGQVSPDGIVGETMRSAPASNASSLPTKRKKGKARWNGLPSDSELLYRWAEGAGLTDPILLGTASFASFKAEDLSRPATLAEQFESALLTPGDQQKVLNRLLDAPAIGTVYLRPTEGDDALRVDVLAGSLGREDQRLFNLVHEWAPYKSALPVVERLLGDYGGLNVYNAALYVVDQEVRLHAQTVDHVYLSVLRRLLDYPIQYDRSTRRFQRRGDSLIVPWCIFFK